MAPESSLTVPLQAPIPSPRHFSDSRPQGVSHSFLCLFQMASPTDLTTGLASVDQHGVCEIQPSARVS